MARRTQNRNKLTRWLLGLSTGIFLVLALVMYWLMAPMRLTADTVDLSIEPGTSVRGVAQAVTDSGVEVSPQALWLMFRLSGQARRLRAGSYELGRETSPWFLLQKLVRGDESLRALTVPEGWTLAQMRRLIDQSEGLRHDTLGLSDAELMARLGRAGLTAEGRFYPDTYTYGKGSPDLRIYQRALRAMDKHLAQAWQARAPVQRLQTPEQALILASIIEKETGRAGDRAMISSVFHNRLRVQMPLQTDPTVIYGLGPTFDGNLKRIHLRTDHPWNTYTRIGLPPTAIALPGKASLMAAVQPASSRALYFVARGDGSSQFSDDLAAHNAAVERYQLRRQSAQGKAQ
ncbi:MAG: endolytic transglycosylase MltG [Alphaproteobacteria bacterium]|nr:endolytic transglycosylase MltG [Alphaproteobacteria bacterium]